MSNFWGALQSLVALLLAVVMIFAVSLVACNPADDKKDDEKNDPNKHIAYGMVHEVYVSRVEVTTDDDGVITDVEIDEVCLPYYANQRFGSSYVGLASTYKTETKVYKEFKFNDKTWTLDESVEYGDHKGDCKGDWKNEDGKYLLASLYADEALCEAWFNAVLNDEIYTLTAENDYTNNHVLSSHTLYKQLNGYWLPGIGISWAGNVKATCDYVVENGLTAEWFRRGDDSIFTDSNGVVTGATWIDMYDYITLIRNAMGVTDALVEAPAVVVPGTAVTADGTYTGSSTNFYATIEATVVVANGKITSVTVSDDSSKHTDGFAAVTDALFATLLESFKGESVATIFKATTTDGFISGGTETSKTVLNAVKDALTAK